MSRKVKICVIVGVIVISAFLVFTAFNGEGKQQHLDRLQEESNRCDNLPSDDGLLSSRTNCHITLGSEILEFCEKYPKDDLLNGNCAYFLDVHDEMERLDSFLNP